MAVIDTFLKMLASQRAERLVVVPERAPSLQKLEETIELPMPAVPAALAKRLAVEVAGEAQTEQLTNERPLEGTYRSDEGDEYTYEISVSTEGCQIVMHAPVPEDDEDDSEARTERTGASGKETHPVVEEAHASDTIEIREETSLQWEASLAGELQQFLEEAVEADASDVFFSAGRPARMRVKGAIKSSGSARCDGRQLLQLLPTDADCKELHVSGSVDFAAQWELAGEARRFRVNVFKHRGGLAAALRPIRPTVPSLEELHLPPNLLELSSYSSGLVLVTGASGSGKSTTLAALIDHINQSKARHIVTIEDPVEFEHRDIKSLIHQREVGRDVESFSSGLRAALRENPDVILLGEMRDLDTISAALTAAETGHLVLSTLHTGSATAAINRIVDVYPGHQQAHVRTQLAASLRAVVAQRLVPTADKSARVPALEKLIVTPAVSHTIREGQEHHMRSAMQTGGEEGMITLERSLASLECRGKISREMAFRYAHDRQALQKLFE